jgi:arginyl-tRNA--protein-N-Asp/Glu arginylyltransferase
MARVLRQLVSGPDACHYLPGASMTTEARVMVDVSAQELDELLARGWRRFGPVYFRPLCDGCEECVSVRVPVSAFTPTRNMQRVLRRGRHLELRVGKPHCDEMRLRLHARWHESRQAERGWEPGDLDRDSYQLQFCFPHPSAQEQSLWDRERLVAVGLFDRTPRALSAVYCYYDPDDEQLSPGTLNVLRTIERARSEGLFWVYLGYRVEGCASLRYKGRFRPQEALRGRPQDGERPRWGPVVAR